MKKAEGSKTYMVSVLKAGFMQYHDMGYKQYLTENTVNKLTQDLKGLKPLLEHIEEGGKIYTRQGQSQIVGVCIKPYKINEPFIIDGKKYRYEDYSSCEIIIDDIETINKIEKQGYLPSIHFSRKETLIDKPSEDIDYIIRRDGKVYQLSNFKVHNIAFVPNPRFETQVRLSQDNLTDADKGIINPALRSQIVNNFQFNCINSKCMFKKSVKNSDGVTEQVAIMQAKLDKILAYIELEQGEDMQEESINEEPAVKEIMETSEEKPEVINQEPIAEEKKEVPVEEKEEVKNEMVISKEEIAKMIKEGIKEFMDIKNKDVKNACETKNEDYKQEDVKNSNGPIAKKAPLFTPANNPVKEAVMQTQNHQKDNKQKTLGGVIFC